MHWPQEPRNVEIFCKFLQQEKMVWLFEMDSEVPRELWEKFEEMPPLFYNKPVPSEAVPQHIKDYLVHSKLKPMYNQRKLVAARSTQKILLYAPLLKWYLEHGLKITVVHRTIDYVPQKTFKWFVEKVTEKARNGDQKAELALLTMIFKFLGNNAYAKVIKALERQTNIKYTKSESVVRK